MAKEITVLTEASLITCIVQRGIADTIVEAAIEAGAQGATIYHAHGSGVRERLGVLGLAVEVEKDVVNIVAASLDPFALSPADIVSGDNSYILTLLLDTMGIFVNPLGLLENNLKAGLAAAKSA